ncbi:MAG: dehypoxanthine futalosine cyclase [Planctomycetes bacterium]|nr:dehypoxanthine futalosine cyclase [Planctomycetota bacterium]MBI3835917.1 dehypoxanthine futalosine cyclase [Planctomycetota bacterium]
MTTLVESKSPEIETSPRIDEQDALDLYRDCSIHELGRRAHRVTCRLHPEPYRTYVVDRNINYANYCSAKCIFCNFKADPPGMNSGRKDLPEGYVLSFAEIGRKIEELIAIGGTQVLMQGGLVPAELLPFDWYLDLMRFIKREYPGIHVHAFSPPEIHAFHEIFGMTVRDVLVQLRDAGLDSIPGGGGEILVDRVRKKIAQGKTTTDQYLHVSREAHKIGLKTSITMMFGHIETIEERLEHLRLIRDLQDETLGFTAYISWTFQPGDTPLGRVAQFPANYAGPNDGAHLMLADADEYLRMTALARIYLDNIPNIQSSWVTQGVKIGQLALFFGCNDMGSVMMEENVVSAAGTTYRLTEQQIRAAVTSAGWIPRKRNFAYQLLDEHPTPLPTQCNRPPPQVNFR